MTFLDIDKRFGFCTYNEKRVFFKVKPHLSERNPILPFPKLLDVLSTKKGYICFYEDCSSHNTWTQELKNVPSDDLANRTKQFWLGYCEKVLKVGLKLGANNSYPARVFFEDRYFGDRRKKWYGENFEYLEQDIGKVYFHDNITPMLLIFDNIQNWLDNTILGWVHGDLHHQNMTLEGFFFDDDTVGYNPMLGDIACYYWYIIALENWLWPKYHVEFHMGGRASNENEQALFFKIFMTEYVLKVLKPIQDGVPMWREEFMFRLFCRMLFCRNILTYTKSDRRRIYSYLFELNEWFLKGESVLPFTNSLNGKSIS